MVQTVNVGRRKPKRNQSEARISRSASVRRNRPRTSLSSERPEPRRHSWWERSGMDVPREHKEWAAKAKHETVSGDILEKEARMMEEARAILTYHRHGAPPSL